MTSILLSGKNASFYVLYYEKIRIFSPKAGKIVWMSKKYERICREINRSTGNDAPEKYGLKSGGNREEKTI
jgi:hypothetical protein